MKIALLGANGQLGSDLAKALDGHEVIAWTRGDFDVRDREYARRAIVDSAPEVVINTTAFHQVDLCETRAEDAFQVNARVPFDLAVAVNRVGAKLVHISTDYVLSGDGSAPLDESSIPAPASVYACSKLAGELAVRNVATRHLVIRTCGLYGVAGGSGKGGNFVETILGKARQGQPLTVVDDQIVTPTWTVELARQMVLMIESDLEGLIHASAGGGCSWYEFARTAAEMCGVPARITPTSSREFGSAASRPPYSVLANRRLEGLGLDRMRHWKDGLADYVEARHGVQAGETRP